MWKFFMKFIMTILALFTTFPFNSCFFLIKKHCLQHMSNLYYLHPQISLKILIGWKHVMYKHLCQCFFSGKILHQSDTIWIVRKIYLKYFGKIGVNCRKVIVFGMHIAFQHGQMSGTSPKWVMIKLPPMTQIDTFKWFSHK